jgi:hypothetical protein
MARRTAAIHERSLVSRFFRNPMTGDVVVFQMPNPPLWLFLAATATRLLTPHGTARDLISLVASASLLVWAVLEIARGESLFRRVLGVVVLVSIVATAMIDRLG